MNTIRSKQKPITIGFFTTLITFTFIVFCMLCAQIKDISDLAGQISDLKANLNNGWIDPGLTPIIKETESIYLSNAIPMAFRFTGAVAVIGLAIYGLIANIKNKGYKVTELVIAISLLITLGNYFILAFANAIAMLEYQDPTSYCIAFIVLSIIGIAFAITYLVLLVKNKNEFLRKGFAWGSIVMVIALNITQFVQISEFDGNNVAVPLVLEIFILLTAIMSILELVFIGEEFDVKIIQGKPIKTQTLQCDPYTQLEKLKSLLDKGIISEEEYKEKRSKYVEML